MIVWKDEHTTLFRSSLYETISSLIVTDDLVLVVDPCWLPHEVEGIKRYVDERKQERPVYLLFTHSDYDHIIGFGAFPNAKVIASAAFDNKSVQEKEAILEQIREFDDEYYVSRGYEISYPNVNVVIKEEKQSITVGDTKLTFFQAPGHNNDGLFTVIEPLGVLLTGDYLSDIEFPYIYFNSYEYEKSILKLDEILSQLTIRLLVTGHGNPTRDKREMKKRQQDSLDYIHKLRESIINNDEEGIMKLIENCRFPRNMKKFHRNNVSLIEKELASR